MQNEVHIANSEIEVGISKFGARLTCLNLDGFRLLANLEEGLPIGSSGQLLCPWPNRIKDGIYCYNSSTYRLAIDEIKNNNAIHGLAKNLYFEVLSVDDNEMVLFSHLAPQNGYPWHLKILVKVEISGNVVAVKISAKNLSDKTAIFGNGWHPYFTFDGGLIDDYELKIPAKKVKITDERSIPVGEKNVLGSEYDFNVSRLIGSTVFDTCYFDFTSYKEIELKSKNHLIKVRLNQGYDYLMVYSGDTLRTDLQRKAIAIEPMTCPPDAFNSREGIIEIEPNEVRELSFEIEAFVL